MTVSKELLNRVFLTFISHIIHLRVTLQVLADNSVSRCAEAQKSGLIYAMALFLTIEIDTGIHDVRSIFTGRRCEGFDALKRSAASSAECPLICILYSCVSKLQKANLEAQEASLRLRT
jgi:hypothetical protein